MTLAIAQSRLVLSLMVALLATAAASAQCATEWLQAVGDGFPREGEVHASTLWDPDGPGPATEHLVVAGNFASGHHIASLDPATGGWSTIGTGSSHGTNGTVRALTVLPNGDLIACGEFTTAGNGLSDRRISRFDGTSWHPLAGGLGSQSQGIVLAVTALPNGGVVAGGSFLDAGGTTVNRIARWNGTSWSAMGTGMGTAAAMTATVRALCTLPNGDVIAGGSFATAGGVPAASIARWDGASWSPLGAGVNGNVYALATMSNGDVVVGGLFTSAGGVAAANIARWNGTNWQALAGGTSHPVTSLAVFSNDDLVVGGYFASAGGVTSNHVARWDGATWSALGSGVDMEVDAVAALPDGDVVVTGVAATFASARIARFDGAAWQDLGSGIGHGTSTTQPVVQAMTYLPNVGLIATGSFRNFGEVVAPGVARWDGTSWSPLGTGLPGPQHYGHAIAILQNGDLVIGGIFGTAFNQRNIARWDGVTWSSLGSGCNTRVSALTTLPNGDLIAAGDFTIAGGVSADHIARWDGSAWSPLGAGLNGGVFALATMANGDVVAGGIFTMAGGAPANRIARWDGTSWSPLGLGGLGMVTSLLALPNGDLMVGDSGFPGRIARWDGTTWSPLGAGVNGLVQSMTTLPNGDLVAGGIFTSAGSLDVDSIARWDGVSWSALGTQMDGGIHTFATMPNGEMVAGGYFSMVEGRYSHGVARVAATCAATVVPSGASCVSSGGNNHFAADNLPWTGATFAATGTGLPSLALIATVTGFSTTAVPLPSLLPQGQPGCVLLVTPALVEFALSTTGTFATELYVPNLPIFAGSVVHQQLLPFEVDASLNFLAITATNSLSITVGTF